MGQPTSGAARLQPRDGCRRQQERTDYLGRASLRRTLPRRRLKTCPGVARRRGNELHRSDRRAESLTIIEAFEAAEREGKAVVVVKGRLVENLHVEEARRLLALAEAIAAVDG